jgi:glycosyltransferase involved in cell wall biosynthesis
MKINSINVNLNKEKLLTILTPTYNRSKNLIKLYDSLKSQTVQNFVWLIIDDGSNDNTKEIV